MNDFLFFFVWWLLGFIPGILWCKLDGIYEGVRVKVEDFVLIAIIASIGPILGMIAILWVSIHYGGPYLLKVWDNIHDRDVW